MAKIKTEVVIVGAGAAGAILAAELCKVGMKVVALERGPKLKTIDFNPHDELRFFQRQDTRPDPKKSVVTWRFNTNMKSQPLNSMSYGNQVGGGTVHYGALSWRNHEDDFRVRSATIERYGAGFLPEGSDVTDWPISYADLEPYYDKAEYDLGVSGRAGNINGQKIAGGNIFEAPRKREFPLPPLRTDVASETFDKATKNLGLHPFISPRAILSEPYKGRPGCTYCGFCQTFGCHVAAKSSTLVNKIPEAEETKNFTVITGAMCYRVNTDSAGKATGVAFYGPDGSDNQVEADLVILAPFVYDNVRLLMLSKTSVHQNGLSNSSGLLGKGLMTHIRPSVFVAFEDKKMNIYMGPNAQRHSIDDYNADNFDHKDLGFIRGGQISIGTAGQQGGPIGAAINMVPPPGIPRYGAAYRDWYAKYFASHMSVGLQIEDLPYLNQTIDLDPDVRDAWGLPAPRITYDWRRPNELKSVAFLSKKIEDIGKAMNAKYVWMGDRAQPGAPGGHHTGGTRMGTRPDNSVVNKYCQSWDIPNLFVVGSSTFPTMSGYNSTLTIEAQAYFVADAITKHYRQAPGPLV